LEQKNFEVFHLYHPPPPPHKLEPSTATTTNNCHNPLVGGVTTDGFAVMGVGDSRGDGGWVVVAVVGIGAA